MTTKKPKRCGAREDYFVEIIHYLEGKVVKRMGPMSQSKADRVEDGVNINLNHSEYDTRIVNRRTRK